ncbi:unnamed protein product [Linum tenue]|uniref:RRM domain-containing protein n=1 Tax=Linum tenue TaxID=586396 RepID=A0AAV0M2R8_9ROSI|nr:unnamed protein product [Linum tenue]
MDLGKLFIGGISWDTNEDRLREYFQVFGDVLEAVIMKDRSTGRARGFGFVVFADPAVAERVVMQKHLIDGRNVEAKKAVPRDDQNILNRTSNNSSLHGSPGPTRTKKIFVGGLASTVTETDFKNYFDQFGTITDVVVMYDHNTQRPRGFGFITFDSEEAVDKVLYKTFHELNGKMVEVKRAVPKELSSSGPARSNQFAGYNYGITRVNSFLNGYSPQAHNPNSVGLRMDGRFMPVTASRSSFSPFNSGGNSNRYWSPIGYGGGNNSGLNSVSRTLWSNDNISQNANSNGGGWNSGLSSFSGALWDSSVNAGPGGGLGPAYNNVGGGEFSVGLGGGGYGRNSGAGFAPVASRAAAANGGYDRAAYADIYENSSLYGDSSWRSPTSELFDSGIGNAASDVITKNTAAYAGGYGIADRQSDRGKLTSSA